MGDPTIDSTNPASLARRFDGTRRPGWQERRPNPAASLPCLRDLTTPSQSWADNEEDASAGIADPVAIGGRFGVRWRARAAREDLTVLRSQDPMLPRALDGELLRYADRMGLDTWEDEGGKLAVRGGFWRVIRIVTPDEGEHADGQDQEPNATPSNDVSTEMNAAAEPATEVSKAATDAVTEALDNALRAAEAKKATVQAPTADLNESDPDASTTVDSL